MSATIPQHRVGRPRLRGVLGALLIAALAALLPATVLASVPTGERMLGQSSIEPAYDDTTGNLTYLLTPLGAPFPTHTAPQAVAPLYLVEYPASYPGWTLNCMGVPGNCPDHDGLVAMLATQLMPTVYGTDPSAVPGHDHLVAVPASGGDFNIAWEVHEVLFTSPGAANEHITTMSQLKDALGSQAAIDIDLGFAFHCSVVPAVTYWRGH